MADVPAAVARIRQLGVGARVAFKGGPIAADTEPELAQYDGTVTTCNRSGIWIEYASGPEAFPGQQFEWPGKEYTYRDIIVYPPLPRSRPVQHEVEDESPPRRRSAKPLASPKPKSDSSDERSSVPSDSSSSSDQQVRHKKRHRKSSSHDSDSSEQRLDRDSGHRVRLTTLVTGLRIPKKINPRHLVWYPIFFRNADDWESSLLLRMQSAGAHVHSQKTQATFDLDVMIVREFIRLRAQLTKPSNDTIPLKEDSVESLRPLFACAARLANVVLSCSPQFGTTAADKFTDAFYVAWHDGRLDFERLWLNASTASRREAPTPVPNAKAIPQAVDVGQVREAFRKEAEDLIKHAKRSERRPRRRGRGEFRGKANTKETKNE